MKRENERAEIDRLIGQPKGWILRWGMSSILLLLVVLFLLGILISYPDELPGHIRLYSGEQPLEVRAERQGRIKALLVTDGQHIAAGQWLGVTDNAAHISDMLKLQQLLDSVNRSPESLLEVDFPGLQLGSLQSDYAAVRFQANWIQEWLEGDRTESKSDLIRQQQEALDISYNALIRQETLLQKEVQLADSSLIRQRALYDRGGISLVELEGFERVASRTRRELEELVVRKSLNRQERNRLAQLRLELGEDRSQWLTDQRIALQRGIFELHTRLEEWILENVWTAPATGTVYIAENRTAGDPVVAGDLLFTVLPTRQDLHWRGEMVITEAGVGKVIPGLEVEISLDGFPEAEYGSVEGIVQTVSLLPEEGYYRLDIAVATPLVTSYLDTIPARPMLSGTAAVITEKRNLLSRIFDRVRAGF